MIKPAYKSESVPTEINFDGLPGPTHNYSGLASGNLASERHKSAVSNPREAALIESPEYRQKLAQAVADALK